MDETRQAMRRFIIALNRMDGLYYQLSRKLGVKDNILWLLYALDDGELHSQKQICEEWLITKTTLNIVVKECEKNGYITLLHPEHSREKLICLTDAGRQYANSLLQPLYRAEEYALKKTLAHYGNEFIDATESLADSLLKESEKNFRQARTGPPEKSI